MSVVVETTLGDITIDLFIKERPRACLNFLKLCKMKYYNYNLFHTINRNFIAQTGDPTGSRNGGESIFGVLEGPLKRYFEAEKQPRIKHTNMGLVSFVGNENQMIGSQFFITLGTDLTYLDEQHCVFGEVVEGLDVLELLNEAICDNDNRPYQDIRITHTVVLDDPMPDPKYLNAPERSPSPSAERLQGGRIAPDEDIDETAGKSIKEIMELQAEREAKARATILEMVGDIPDAEMAPPENVLFVCKLNPITTDDDLEIIFSRFGRIKSCEVIRDKKTADSLQYAFVEFEDQKSCEDAYFKMDNVLIDDRRIHVDFSQSVAKIKWHGKGRGVTTYDDKGRKTRDVKNDIGNGRYESRKEMTRSKNREEEVRYDKRRDYNERENNYNKYDSHRNNKKYEDRSEYYRRNHNSHRNDKRERSPERTRRYEDIKYKKSYKNENYPMKNTTRERTYEHKNKSIENKTKQKTSSKHQSDNESDDSTSDDEPSKKRNTKKQKHSRDHSKEEKKTKKRRNDSESDSDRKKKKKSSKKKNKKQNSSSSDEEKSRKHKKRFSKRNNSSSSSSEDERTRRKKRKQSRRD